MILKPALNKIYLSSLQRLRSVKGRQCTVLLTKSSWINRKHKKSDWWYWTQGILNLNNKRSYVCGGGGNTQAKDLPERKKDDDQAYGQEKQILLGCMRDAGSDSSPYSWCTGPKTYGSFQDIYLTEWSHLPFGSALMCNVSRASDYFCTSSTDPSPLTCHSEF